MYGHALKTRSAANTFRRDSYTRQPTSEEVQGEETNRSERREVLKVEFQCKKTYTLKNITTNLFGLGWGTRTHRLTHLIFVQSTSSLEVRSIQVVVYAADDIAEFLHFEVQRGR